MDEKDGTFTDDFNKLSLDRFDDDYIEKPTFGSPLDYLNNKNQFDDYNPLSDLQTDTTDSMHKDILSKLRLTNKRDPPKAPKHLNPQFIPKVSFSKNDQNYFMDHRSRGKCIIINNTYFDSPTLPERKGTQVDRDRLTSCFKKLDFDVQNWDEKNAMDIRINIDRLSKEDFTDQDCLIVCVLTHGDANCLYAKDEKYYIEYLFESFKSDVCKTLAGKPKIFIIQACRGDRLDNGSIIQFDVEDSNSSDVRIPQWADFLMAYSTIPGYYSWRNTTNGSWFIQAFTSVLMDHYKELDLLSMFTITNQKVAYDFESNTPNLTEFHQRKQIPMIASMLTRRVYFKKPKKSVKLPERSINKVANETVATSSSSASSAQSIRRLTKEELIKQQIILNEKMMKSADQRAKNGN